MIAPQVCPVRNKFLGTFIPKNDTVDSVDTFVLTGLQRWGSTPHSIMERNIKILHFIQAFIPAGFSNVSAAGCLPSTLFHSKYEDMVTNFSNWARAVLQHLVAPKGQRQALHASLYEQYKDDFVPNGKHKHALVMGANIAKLKSSSIRILRQNSVLNGLLQGLGYDWMGHDLD